MKKTFLTSGVIALALFGWLDETGHGVTASLAEQNALASKVDFETPPQGSCTKLISVTAYPFCCYTRKNREQADG